MIAQKRGRGRPVGSGKDDAPYLRKVADLLVAESKLTASSAMKRVMATRTWSETRETLLRRWQAKWKSDGSKLLAEAKERASQQARDVIQPARAKSEGQAAGFGSAIPAMGHMFSAGELHSVAQFAATALKDLDVGSAFRQLNEHRNLATLASVHSARAQYEAAVSAQAQRDAALNAHVDATVNSAFALRAQVEAFESLNAHAKTLEMIKQAHLDALRARDVVTGLAGYAVTGYPRRF